MATRRLMGLSGIVFVGFVVVGLAIVGSTPGSDASGSELVSYYDGWRQFIGAFVLAASVPFLVLFGVGVATVADRSAWGLVLVVGTAVAGAVVLVQAFVHLALTDGVDQGVSESTLRAVNILTNSTWIALFAAFGVMMIGAAGVLLAARQLIPLGWIALVLGIAAFIPVADFVDMLATLLWILVTSVALGRRAFRAAPGAARNRDLRGTATPARSTTTTSG